MTKIIGLFTQEGIQNIEKAIAKSEKITNGEIKVALTEKSYQGSLLRRILRKPAVHKAVMKKAKKSFDAMKMHKTKNRTGVLIFLSLKEHHVIVVGDTAVAEHCNDDIWKEMRDMIIRGMQAKRETAAVAGICSAVRMAGDILSNYFPKTSDNTNELPDKVEIIP